MSYRIVAALAVLLCSTLAVAANVARLDGTTISPAQIDRTVTRAMSAAHVTGVAIALFNHGGVVYQKSYGFCDVEKKLPLTPDSVMTAASLTKPAFAYLVLQLVDKKLLDLDKPVYEYLPKPLPDYSAYADLAGDARYKKITARMLLSHTSGFPNWRRFTDSKKLFIAFEPGSRFAYSGEGIDLLQLVVESITGKPLDVLMQQRVFGPLGMTRSSMVWDARFESDYANGYDEQGRSLGPQRRTRPDAAGGMQTTLHDYSKFLAAIAHSGGLSRQTYRAMLSPQVRIHSLHEFPSLDLATTHANDGIRLSYGLGWGLYWTPYGKAFFKEGHDDGWRHYCVLFDRSGAGLLIMTNSSNGEAIYQTLLETLLKDSFTPMEWESFPRSASN